MRPDYGTVGINGLNYKHDNCDDSQQKEEEEREAQQVMHIQTAPTTQHKVILTDYLSIWFPSREITSNRARDHRERDPTNNAHVYRLHRLHNIKYYFDFPTALSPRQITFTRISPASSGLS